MNNIQQSMNKTSSRLLSGVLHFQNFFSVYLGFMKGRVFLI